jgi:hypothetical protein
VKKPKLLSPTKGLTLNQTFTPPKVTVGEAFTETDIRVGSNSDDLEGQTRARATIIIVGAFVIFYGAFMAHEWSAGNSFTMIGQFLENMFVGFVGWCIGKDSSKNRAGP